MKGLICQLVVLCLVLLEGPSLWANGFVSLFKQAQYETFLAKKKEEEAEQMRKQEEEEKRRLAEEMRRRQQKKTQVVKLEDPLPNFSSSGSNESLAQFMSKESKPEEVEEPVKVEELGLSLSGVVTGGDLDQAIINSRVYVVGDKINSDIEVVSIVDDRVDVRYKEQILALTVPMMPVVVGTLDQEGSVNMTDFSKDPYVSNVGAVDQGEQSDTVLKLTLVQ